MTILILLAIILVEQNNAEAVKESCLEPCLCETSVSHDPDMTDQVDKLTMKCDINNDINGDLDSFLANFPSLTSLTLTNLPSPQLPESICNMRHLGFLSITSSKLRSGGIPSGCFGQLQHLKTLSLSKNQIEYIQTNWFSGLENLEVLELRGNNIRDLPDDFASLYFPKLISFDFQNNKLKRVDSWPLKFIFNRDITDTLQVDLEYNEIENLTDFTGWQQYGKLNGEELLGKIDFWGNNIAYLRDIFHGWKLPPMESNRTQSVVTMDICGNTFNCDCIDTEWRKFLNARMSKTLPVGFHEIVEHVRCTYPVHLESRFALSLSEDEFVCNIIEGCPHECTCSEIPASKTLKVDCSKLRGSKQVFTSLPESLPPPKSKSLIPGNFTYTLNFAGNGITILEYAPYLSSTVYLDISNNNLENITVEAVQALENVQSLYLNGNRLTSLPPEIACCHSLSHISEITLHGNKWKCGCHTIDTWRWMSKHIKHISDSDKIVCSEYNRDTQTFTVESLYTMQDKIKDCEGQVTKGFNWILLSFFIVFPVLLSIAFIWFCRRRISTIVTNYKHSCCVEKAEEDRIIVPTRNSRVDHASCNKEEPGFIDNEKTTTEHEPPGAGVEMEEIKMEDWDIPSQPIQPTLDYQKKTHDAFISYSSVEEDYVIKNIAERLESLGYKTIFSRRDFTAGNRIIENIAEAVECSSRTVFYCSRSFFESTFCKWEILYVADEFARCNQNTFLIIKSKHFIDSYPNEFTKILQGMKIGMFTYIEEDSPYFWDQFLKALQRADSIRDL